MSTRTCVLLCSSWRPRGHGLTLTRCSEDAAREGSSHTPEGGVFSTQASEASEAPTPPPPEPATPAASEATKLDSEIAEQRRQLETEREALRARRLSRSCRHSHSGAGFSPDSLRTSPSAAGSSPSAAGASPAFPASPACSRAGSSPCGLGAERTPSALTAASEAATVEVAAAPAVGSPASVVYSIAGHPLYDAPPASPARRSDSRASLSSAEENRPANGSRHRHSAEATTVPAKAREMTRDDGR